MVTEYLIRYCELIFNSDQTQDKQNGESGQLYHQNGGRGAIGTNPRPKSLAISTPTKLLSLEEARTRQLLLNSSLQNTSCQKFIEVGGGPDKLPPKYHTVIDLPSKVQYDFFYQ